jgi:RNA polymerase sigma-70 factor (ECF subfamily)
VQNLSSKKLKKIERNEDVGAVPQRAQTSNRMHARNDEFIPTRQSLLERLKRWDDQESWRDFFDTYSGLLYASAIRAGLKDSEAQDVVQDTVILVSRKMKKGFKYDPAVDSFKGWLLFLTRKRIALEYRKLARNRVGTPVDPRAANGEVEEIQDVAAMDLETIWEEEWKRAMWDAAVAQVKKAVAPKQFQMFDLYVLKERPAAEVARALDTTVAQVYLAKHRVSALVKKELTQLQARFE